SKRMFSSSSTCPSARSAAAALAPAPMVSGARVTGAPSSSPRRSATGAREKAGSTVPFGRPRWAVTITFAPASVSRFSVGSAARMRPSSVMVVPSRGTLKSERTRTRLPRRSPRSSMVFMCKSSLVLLVEEVRADMIRARVRTGTRARVIRLRCSEPLADVAGEVHHALGEAPLVVVPGDDLHLVADHPGHARVEDARGRVAGDVGGDQRVLGVDQDALELLRLGGSLHSGVHLLDGDLPGCGEGQVGG